MEVALQLIQLSGESDADLLYPHELSNSASEASTTASKRRRRRRNEIVNDAASTTSFITPWFHDDDGVAGSRRKRKKYRSVVEIYESDFVVDDCKSDLTVDFVVKSKEFDTN
ncbi:hypothetical protein L1987_55045 [Smallanthus sonchifolius]|uniref:Uncharacterized protein n=1 Tax=Smallanthus sonchifolius TaxID=185202 RepID=A0ACB9E8I5_9ASTR|nr:hypothetical protein L1987_55045 [Smallanthus sonchifolius]